MTSESYGNLFTPLWDPILHQLYKMANHELRYLCSLELLAVGDRVGNFLYKRVGGAPNDSATSCSESGRWMEMKDFMSNWRSDWFED